MSGLPDHAEHEDHSEKVPFYNDPVIRGYIFQAILIVVVGYFFYSIVNNAITNLEEKKIASGFGFLSVPAGFDITQSLIEYNENSTYFRAALVGFLNTLLVAVVGIIIATVLGFLVGIGRLSANKLIAGICTVYVEVIRNIPPLLQLIFWYIAVLRPLPGPRDSIAIGEKVFINNRGLFFPEPVMGDGFNLVIFAFFAMIFASIFITRWSRKRQESTGKQFPAFLFNLGLLVFIPLAVFFILGRPMTFNIPSLQGFNISGGLTIIPEFVALVLGLSLYTAGFIAEVIRAGILAVSKGQTEAAHSLGLRSNQTLKLVIIPQAMRVIIPPLTNQFLNLTKNSSLAVAIGYPDLVQVYTGTVLNQTGQAIEVVATTMLVYLTLSLLTSGFMNWYNKRISLVER